MKSVMAAWALMSSLAVLGASGCGAFDGRSANVRPFVPTKSCIDLLGDDYARCSNRELEKTENVKRYRANAMLRMNQLTPVPRTCVPDGSGKFECH
jgi:hypothetical protein